MRERIDDPIDGAAQTPLMLAVLLARPLAVTILLDMGADKSITSGNCFANSGSCSRLFASRLMCSTMSSWPSSWWCTQVTAELHCMQRLIRATSRSLSFCSKLAMIPTPWHQMDSLPFTVRVGAKAWAIRKSWSCC